MNLGNFVKISKVLQMQLWIFVNVLLSTCFITCDIFYQENLGEPFS